MALRALVSLTLLSTGTTAILLTEKNWQKVTEGKSVFVKFMAPSCDRCAEIKPDWDKLMKDFKDSPYILAADVDCESADGEKLCTKYGVEDYPTIKYTRYDDERTPDAYQRFEGVLEYHTFKMFADKKLGLQCGFKNIDLCDEAKKTKIETFGKMSLPRLEGRLKNFNKVYKEDVPLMQRVMLWKNLAANKAEL